MAEKETELQASEVKLIYKSRIPKSKRVQIKCSLDAFRLFWESWDKDVAEHHEQFKVMLLNTKNEVLGIAEVSSGGIKCTLIDNRIVFQYALKAHATGIILGHNHPSSNSSPSETDVDVTRKLIKAGSVLNMQVLDHIILCGDGSYYSLADEGRM